ncbi:MAG TPA: hypothetical protein VM263_10980, partial [Acidimicrobiales bacterium]|nr:hypothetical protein [Acidimicrobiales bacterium]
TQTVEYRFDLPFFGPLFRWPLRRELARLAPRQAVPWWAPPDRLDPRAAQALAALCALSVVVGYLGTVLTQTITFAAGEFGAGKGAHHGTACRGARRASSRRSGQRNSGPKKGRSKRYSTVWVTRWRPPPTASLRTVRR